MPPTSRKNAKYFKKKIPWRLHFRPFGIRSHGRHCGPYWSDGRWQESVCGRRGIDAHDETCRDHDCRIHHGLSRKWADRKFVKANWGKSVRRSIDAAAVYVNGLFESDSSSKKNELMLATPAKSQRGRSMSRSRSRSRSRSASMSISNSGSAGSGVAGGNVVKFRSGKHPVGARRKMDISKHLRLGVVWNLEQNGVMSSQRAGYLGHITFPLNRMGYQISRAIVKRLFHAQGIEFQSWDEPVNNTLGSDVYFIQIEYYDKRTSVTPLYIQINTTAPMSFKTLADLLWTQTSSVGPPAVTAGLREVFTLYRNPRFTSMFLKKNNSISTVSYDYVEINLESSTFEFDCSSTFKIQNTCASTQGNSDPDETTAVDAIPLYYRSYEGYGTGTSLKTLQQKQTIPFIGDIDQGVISVNSTTPGWNQDLHSLPYKQQFNSIKDCNTGYFQPGELIVSTMQFHKTLTFDRVAMYFNNIYTETYSFMPTGSFRFFGFDKVLQQSGDSSFVVVQYEHEQVLACSIHPGKKSVTQPINDTI